MNYNTTNLLIAIVLSLTIIFGWQYFYERPKMARQQVREASISHSNTKHEHVVESRPEVQPSFKRVAIESKSLSGSIALQGLRFDDLVLRGYKENLSKDSPEVRLLSYSGSEKAYFAEIGWVSNAVDADFPDNETMWSSDGEVLTPDQPIHLFWVNKNGVKFLVTITLDDNYLFTVQQTILNNSEQPVSFQSYGIINRKHSESKKSVNILHQGPIGYIDSSLQEYSYDNIKDKKIEKFSQTVVDWIGITDKYWLVSLIPDKTSIYSANFNYAAKQGQDRFQADFISPAQILAQNQTFTITHKLFAGAKKVDLLDKYEKQYNIKLFDRAIDFGWFYIITKPLFYAMNFFYHYVGNFGVSILIVTVIIKLLMFTLANKSYRSMKNMKRLQPEIERIKNLYADDKMRLNQEVMGLYKKEKVNPVSGCLPLLVQIPVFFSIYKVLYVTIEMRQAPFFGWIKDLSSPDPTTIFNLFGLLPFTPPGFLMIGAWPIIMAITMFLQQRMSPEPADPIQAQVMKFMPLIFLVMFSSFPAGLLIYWSWNNILSIIQQYYINRLDKA